MCETRLRVDFYQLSRDPSEAVVARLAEQTLKAGARLLVVTGDDELSQRISQSLWSHRPESFLAHGIAGEGADSRQPILISDGVEPANGARYTILADGVWRDPPDECERVFLLFGEATIAAAREQWRALPPGERNFWKQGAAGWEKVA